MIVCDTEHLTGNTAHTLCYHVAFVIKLLFVYIAMSYDGVWVVVWMLLLTEAHISPRCLSKLWEVSVRRNREKKDKLSKLGLDKEKLRRITLVVII